MAPYRNRCRLDICPRRRCLYTGDAIKREPRRYLILMMERLQDNNGYRLLTVEVGLVWIVHKHAIILRVANAIAVNVRIALVALAVAVGIQLIGVRYFGTVVYAVLNSVPVVRMILIINGIR